jgi:serine/threonine protein kinase
VRYCERCGAAFQSTKVCPKDKVETRADLFDPLLGRVLGDRYRILERVGAGAMGQVYRAAHNRISCIFAVKVLYGDLAYNDEMLSRFLREAELASCLQSRHIVRVTDFGNENGALPYMVMEYLDGPSLHEVIGRQGPLAPERAVTITQRILRGLGLAHERGVIHRDLKPENVALVTEDDEPDVVKLLDFGVARMRDGERMTAYGVVVGTPLYMSPEQLMGQDIDARSDLYSLGVCLYEMLVGKPPYDGASVQDIARSHIAAPIPSTRAAIEQKGGPIGIDAVVQRLLAKKPEDRYGSAREVIEALSAVLKGRVPTSSGSLPPPSSTTQPPLRKSSREAIEQTIILGAPTYNSGDHAGCYALYRKRSEEIVREAQDPVAVTSRLEAALARAATRQNPTDAAWDMRYGFDDLLLCEPVAAQADPITYEVSAYRAIVTRREAEGALDIVGDYALAFARALAKKLRADPARATAANALEDASNRGAAAGGGNHALPFVGPVLAALTAGERPPPSFGAPPTLAGAPLSPPSLSAPVSAPLSGVDDAVRLRIVRAIKIGAPAYNEGRPEVCARVYRDAVKEILEMARPNPRAEGVVRYVEKALREASGRTPTEAAWVIRHAFDAILASG